MYTIKYESIDKNQNSKPFKKCSTSKMIKNTNKKEGPSPCSMSNYTLLLIAKEVVLTKKESEVGHCSHISNYVVHFTSIVLTYLIDSA